METYAIYLYADGEIQWTTGDADGGVNGLGENPAQVGFDGGDGTDFGVIPISGTADVINIASTSNVGVNGVYVFKISDDSIAVEQSKKPHCSFCNIHIMHTKLSSLACIFCSQHVQI